MTRDFLARNASNIVQVNVVNEDALDILADYSPEIRLPLQRHCEAAAADQVDERHQAHRRASSLEFHGPKPAYTYPLDAPEYNDTRGPNCYRPAEPAGAAADDPVRGRHRRTIPRFASRNGMLGDPAADSRASLDTVIPPTPTAPAAIAPLEGPLSKLLGAGERRHCRQPVDGRRGHKTEQRLDELSCSARSLGRPAAKVPAYRQPALSGPLARGTQVNVG